MFHEFTLHKILSFGAAALAFAVAISTFVYYETTQHIVERSFQFVMRSESDFLYALLYNPPWGQAAAVGAAGSAPERSVPVLLYHGTPPEGNDNPPLPQNVFVDQMRALKADGWQTITLAQLESFMKNGTSLPPKSFLLTFDDARKESFYPVDPVLKDLGYNAVMFVITGFSLPPEGSKPSTFYLDRTELEFMQQSGRWELESHGDMDHKLYDVPTTPPGATSVQTLAQQHFLTNKFWLAEPGREETDAEYTARIKEDLQTSKNKLETLLNTDVTAFAYPFNDYGQEGGNFEGARDVLSQVVPGVYSYAFVQVNTAKDDPFNYSDPHTWTIKRIEPTADWSGADLVARLDAAQAKELPYDATPFKAGEWSSNWGSAQVGNNTLTLTATDKTSGAVALLNGSMWWQNYAIDATVNWKQADAVSLVGRYLSDSKTFFTCAFTQGNILLQSHEDGKTQTVAGKKYEPGDLTDLQIHMALEDDTVSCEASGVKVSESFDEPFIHAGSMGVQVWGSTLGAESLEVKSISASQR